MSRDATDVAFAGCDCDAPPASCRDDGRTTGASSGRIAWIDVAKGLGIVLMTLGHVGEAPGGGWMLPALEVPIAWVYLFHMPAFFLLGGLTYRRGQEMRPFVAKKARTLLVPYVIYSSYFFVKASVVAASQGADVAAALVNSLYDVLLYGRGLWFLAAYFVGELVAYACMDVCRLRGAFLCAAGIALFAFSFYWFEHIAQTGAGTPPFECVNGLQAGGLICVGASLRPHLPSESPVRRTTYACALCVALAVFFCAGRRALAGEASMPEWSLRAVAALSGSLALALLALLAPRFAALERVGRDSLLYYVVAPETTNVIRICAAGVLGAASIEPGDVTQWLLAVVMTVSILALSQPVVTFVRRRLPWSVGLSR